MNNISRKWLLLAAFLFPALLSVAGARSQDGAGPDFLQVETIRVVDWPVDAINPMLVRSEKVYLLKCQISNTADERIRGVTYQHLVLDPTNKPRAMAGRSAAVKLPGYESKD